MDAEITEKTKVIHGKLLALREECGGYIIYVFEIIGGIPPFEKYVMCTRFPNWETPFISIGDVGYLKYREVIAGKDIWYDGDKFVPYKYTGIHFLDFVLEKPKCEDIVV